MGKARHKNLPNTLARGKGVTSSPSPREGFVPSNLPSDQVRLTRACVYVYEPVCACVCIQGEGRENRCMCVSQGAMATRSRCEAGAGNRVHTLNHKRHAERALEMAGSPRLSQPSPVTHFPSKVIPPVSQRAPAA